MNEAISFVFISIGLLFNFFGCVGLVRFPDLYNRLQASTKCVTLGTCLVLCGVLLFFGISGTGIKAVICAVFILITSPAAAHAIARGAHLSGVKLWEKSVVDRYSEDRDAKT